MRDLNDNAVTWRLLDMRRFMKSKKGRISRWVEERICMVDVDGDVLIRGGDQIVGV